MLDLENLQFAPVIHLPPTYEVFDLSAGYDPQRNLKSPYGIGKYNEKRPEVYTQEIFAGSRNIHMGIDIACPVGTPVHCFFAGEIFLFDYNSAPGDYGYTLVTQHVLNGTSVWALYGHLSGKSLAGKVPGQKISTGERIGWVGDRHENGGWNPHLHFQLSLARPEKADMPGVVSEADRAHALITYPDPRLVLGKLY